MPKTCWTLAAQRRTDASRWLGVQLCAADLQHAQAGQVEVRALRSLDPPHGQRWHHGSVGDTLLLDQLEHAGCVGGVRQNDASACLQHALQAG